MAISRELLSQAMELTLSQGSGITETQLKDIETKRNVRTSQERAEQETINRFRQEGPNFYNLEIASIRAKGETVNVGGFELSKNKIDEFFGKYPELKGRTLNIEAVNKQIERFKEGEVTAGITGISNKEASIRAVDSMQKGELDAGIQGVNIQERVTEAVTREIINKSVRNENLIKTLRDSQGRSSFLENVKGVTNSALLIGGLAFGGLILINLTKK